MNSKRLIYNSKKSLNKLLNHWLVITNNVAVAEKGLLSGENQRFRAITQGSSDALYAITDAVLLYRINKK